MHDLVKCRHLVAEPISAPTSQTRQRDSGSGPDRPGPDQPGPNRPGPDQPGPDRPGPGIKARIRSLSLSFSLSLHKLNNYSACQIFVW